MAELALELVRLAGDDAKLALVDHLHAVVGELVIEVARGARGKQEDRRFVDLVGRALAVALEIDQNLRGRRRLLLRVLTRVLGLPADERNASRQDQSRQEKKKDDPTHTTDAQNRHVRPSRTLAASSTLR